MRNLAVKVPTDLWPEFKARASACYQAPSRAIARDLAKGMRTDYGTLVPSAVACFEDDFEACIAHLRLPVTHRRSTRTTLLHGSGSRAHWPLPRRGSSGADVLRASELQHAVEDVDTDIDLGHATPVRARA